MKTDYEKILSSSLSVDEKVEEITKVLSSLPDQGVTRAVDCIMHAKNLAQATYFANYLALLPNHK